MNVNVEDARQSSSDVIVGNISYTRPVWQLLLLMVLSCGLYMYVWCYQNWEDLKNTRNWDIRPVFKTLGLLIPVYAFIVLYRQFKNIEEVAEIEGVGIPVRSGWFIFSILISPFFLRFGDYLGVLISVMAILLPFILCQIALNTYWKKLGFKHSLMGRWNISEAVSIFFGIGVWCLLFYT